MFARCRLLGQLTCTWKWGNVEMGRWTWSWSLVWSGPVCLDFVFAAVMVWSLASQLVVWSTNKSGSELHFNWLAKLLEVLAQVQNV